MPADTGAGHADGRRRKGSRRRAQLLAATVRLIGRSGVAAVTQRAVAAEAGLPPSAVFYYFATVDELLVATLTAVNDRYRTAIDTLPADRAGALAGLVSLIVQAPDGPADRDRAVAEYELCLLAARRPELRVELERWTATLDALADRLVADPVRRAAFAVAVDGLFLRAATAATPPDPARTTAVLELLTEPAAPRTGV